MQIYMAMEIFHKKLCSIISHDIEVTSSLLYLQLENIPQNITAALF